MLKTKFIFSYLLLYLIVFLLSTIFYSPIFELFFILNYIYILILLLYKRYLLSFLFIFILLEMYTLNIIKISFLNLELGSWREFYNNENMINSAFYYIHISLGLLGFVFLFMSIINNKVNQKYFKRNSLSIIRFSNYKLNIFVIFSFIFYFLYIALEVPIIIQGKLFWMENRINFPFYELFNLLTFLIVYLVFFKKINKKTIKILKNISLLLILILFIAGFRAPLISYLFVLFVVYYLNNKIKINYIFYFSILMPIFYLTITIIGTLRRGIEGFSIKQFFLDVGNHELNEFFTLVGVMHHDLILYGASYLDALMRLLPKFITGDIGMQFERISETIARLILPDYTDDSKINMGTFIISELYLNFQFFGVLLGSILLGYLFSVLEIKKYKNDFFQIVYYSSVVFLFSLIYYGSSNFIKLFFYQVLFILITLKFLKAKKV